MTRQAGRQAEPRGQSSISPAGGRCPIGPSLRSRKAFSFLEVIIGVIILTFGLIPLLWALSQSHQGVGITLRQVQAANHAGNLLEALRATPYQDLALFPSCMIQLRGGDNVWRKADAAGEIELVLPEQAGKPAPSGSTQVFDKFVKNFFDKDHPVVPPMERPFARYFIIIRDDDRTPRYITLLVRVVWEKSNKLKSVADNAKKWRHVELRTVLADPYFCDS